MRQLLLRTLLSCALTFITFNAVCQNDGVYPPLNKDDTLLLAKNCLEKRINLAKSLDKGVIILNNNENTTDDFFYLTGWSTLSASCFFEIDSDTTLTLFIPNNTAQSVIWNGIQPGKDEAHILGANPMHIFDYKKQLKEVVRSGKKMYLFSQDKVTREILKGLIKNQNDSDNIAYIDTIIHRMRLQKSDYEIQNIRKAIDITQNALLAAFKATTPQKYEYEIAALFNYEYTRNGVKEAFGSIVGSGVNSTYLHYTSNNKIMNEGDLLLMDVGAKYNRYAADITRTIPVDGKFSKEQLTLYNITLKIQEECINSVKPGLKISTLNQKYSNLLTNELYKLGFITDTTKQWQKKFLLLHPLGHNVGLDVHDVGLSETFIPGMVYTIEPGIYINPALLDMIYELNNNIPRNELNVYVEKVKPVFEKYANIGIRIEDDILVTPTGKEVLSAKIPKQPDEIERIMRKK
jgi:Xaa-Pro aminopeptidase